MVPAAACGCDEPAYVSDSYFRPYRSGFHDSYWIRP